MHKSSANSSEDRTVTKSVATSVLERAKADDAVAWEKIVSVFGPDIYAWCRRSGLQSSDAKDVVQKVFASVTRSLPSFRRDKPGDTFRGWLWTITKNKIRDLAHSREKRPAALGGTDGVDIIRDKAAWDPSEADESSIIGDNRHAMRRALQSIQHDFEPKTWTAFWRLAIDGHSSAEIAEDLGMTPVGVRQAKARVMRRLREEFGELVGI